MTTRLTTTPMPWHCGACLLLLLANACTQPSADGATAGPSRSDAAATPASTNNEDATVVHYAHDDAGEPGLVLPVDIVRALGTDERALSCAEGTRDGVSQFAPDWVAVRRIDLNDDGRGDWIVNGRHACLRDGDAAGWWVYADTADTQRLLLAGAMATELDVLAARTQAFRDLRLRQPHGDAIARYDGSTYVLPSAPATVVSSSATTDDAAATSQAPPTGPVDTLGGRIEIGELPRADDGRQAFRVTLDGRELLRTGRGGGKFEDFPRPEILRRYPQGIEPFDEVLVFQQRMRGNACNGGPLWILGLRRDGSHAVSDPIDFCGGRDPELSATREALTITLPGGPPNRGEGMIPTETWRYRDGKLERIATP
jgi:hypothetical protein